MKANKAVLGSLHFLLPISPLSKREKKIFEKYLRKKRTNKRTQASFSAFLQSTPL
jgi:hypothetical protein